MNRTKAARVSKDRERLQNPYAHLQPDGTFDAIVKVRRELRAGEIAISVDEVRGCPIRPRVDDQQFEYSTAEIKQMVRKLHEAIWVHRQDLWEEGPPDDPVSLLDPAVALRLLGYDFTHEDTLGEFRDSGARIEVAGVIDSDEKAVKVSRRFAPHIRKFTSAHELAHAVMHPSQGLHRDRAMDGSKQISARNAIETEADQFATLFLMPAKLVESRFEQQFLTNCFAPTPERAYALGVGSSLKEKCKSNRDLATTLAKAEYFNGENVTSLANQFGVSVEAMAIRIEELKLATL